MASGVRSKYHIALNGNGFVLRGAPGAPRYTKDDAPLIVSNLRFAARFGLDDFTQSQLNGSGWSYWTQTDWTGGFNRIKWKDDGSFRSGQAIDPIAKFGNISLQNDFTSALSISGSHGYGTHNVHDGSLLFGTVKGSGGAKLFRSTSAHVMSQVSASVGISAFNSMSRYGKYTLAGLTRTSGSTLKTLVGYYERGTSGFLSGFRATNQIVRAVRGIGVRAYISEYIASLSGDQLSYTTTLSAFTSAYNAGKGRKISRIIDLNGQPYIFIEEGRRLEFLRWDELSEKAFPIYKWDDLTNYGVTRFLTFVMITGTSNGKKVAYAFNGARIVQIFIDQLLDTNYDFSKPFEFQGQLHVKGAKWDAQNWFPGLYGKYATVQYTPFVNYASKAYGYAITGTKIKLGYVDTSRYALSGNVVSSQYGGDVGGIDKLINSVLMDFDTLKTGETVEVFHSNDEGASFTSVGKASFSQDGAINSKRIYFPSGTISKLWNSKVQLAGPGTTTPQLQDITYEFRPVPDLKKRWQVTIDAGNDIALLNKQREQRDGKAIMSQLWLEKEAKRTVLYEDVDAFAVNLISAMAASATSARVKDVRLMPPKGRMRVLKNNVAEEMTYTSADGGRILGISRGKKGTLARAYTSADVIDNFYTVNVVSVREQVNDTDQNTSESIAQLVLLEV